MSQACCASCAKHGVARQVSWEDEDLTVSADGSAILNLTPESLEDKVRSGDLLIVWFYAPWCKQCKLVRPALEQAAQALAGHVAFGRLDCAQHPSAKRAHGVYSYPAFKAFRAGGSRWVEVPKVQRRIAPVSSRPLPACPPSLPHPAFIPPSTSRSSLSNLPACSPILPAAPATAPPPAPA
jgi:thiol-disulfide isomerase/thioredoxin